MASMAPDTGRRLRITLQAVFVRHQIDTFARGMTGAQFRPVSEKLVSIGGYNKLCEATEYIDLYWAFLEAANGRAPGVIVLPT
jgi:hypothetical protein